MLSIDLTIKHVKIVKRFYSINKNNLQLKYQTFDLFTLILGGGLPLFFPQRVSLICVGTSIIIKMSTGSSWRVLQGDNKPNEKSFRNNPPMCIVSQTPRRKDAV